MPEAETGMLATEPWALGQLISGPMEDGTKGIGFVIARRGSICTYLVAITRSRVCAFMTSDELAEKGWARAPQIVEGTGWTMEAWVDGAMQPLYRVTLPHFEDAASLLSTFNWKGVPLPEYQWALRERPADPDIDESMFFDDAGAMWPHPTLPPWAPGGDEPDLGVPIMATQPPTKRP